MSEKLELKQETKAESETKRPRREGSREARLIERARAHMAERNAGIADPIAHMMMMVDHVNKCYLERGLNVPAIRAKSNNGFDMED